MSELLDIGQQISLLVTDAKSMATWLYQRANELQKTQMLFQQQMQGSAQQNCQHVIAQMMRAIRQLANAADSLAEASRSGVQWMERHGSAGGSGPSQTSSGSISGGEPASEKNTAGILTQAAAFALLSKYMSDHNYGIADYPKYSQDPVWQELHEKAFPEKFERPDPASSSSEYASLLSDLKGGGVDYLPLQAERKEKTQSEIIQGLGGGDNTKGSCSSLAFAYAGNIAGYHVLDFRDGDSRSFFCKRKNIETIASLPGVQSRILQGTDDVACADDLLVSMTPGKEYYLATGRHAAVVRKTGGHFEYLELQHPTDNGWHLLTDSELINRFGCSESRLNEVSNILMDIESLAGNQEFLGILGFLNTAETQQNKGVNGSVR